MEEIAPASLAEDWDPVGLQVGRRQGPCRSVLVALDATPEILGEAVRIRADLVLVHHPLVFSPLARLDLDRPYDALVSGFVRQDVTVFAAHTNLDACPGGVAEALANALGLPEGGSVPVVVRSCAACRFPEGSAGHGRVGDLPGVLPFPDFCRFVRSQLDSPGLHHLGFGPRPIRRVAVFGGSFDGDWIPDVVRSGADAVVAGEIRHHDLLDLARHGIPGIAAGHDCSERVVLEPLAARLAGLHPEIRFAVAPAIGYT